MPGMRFLLIMLAATAAFAQVPRQTESPGTKEDLRGVSVVSEQVAWASGTHGTYLLTTDGARTWSVGQVAGAETLDFRGVVGFSADEAFLMSSGAEEQSRIYHTSDAGQHWKAQFTSTNPKAFFDAMAFWDSKHGIVLGDPVADESGKLRFQLLATSDGETWSAMASPQMPEAVAGEGAFAASNSCMAILRGGKRERAATQTGEKVAPAVQDDIWFATGGSVARVFHSGDGGVTWEVFLTPIVHGADSEGIFSIAFRDADHGVIAGGDDKHPDRDGPDLGFTNDGGKTWSLSPIFPQSYFSAVTYDRRELTPAAAKLGVDRAGVRLFLAAPKFIFDFRPPKDPTRISPRKKSGIGFNAVSAFPGGGALFVGPKGSMATIP
jgi:photosystem II stability/assembly factor-like uncharacterized protein